MRLYFLYSSLELKYTRRVLISVSLLPLVFKFTFPEHEGSRQNIEAFFAANEHPTPAGWNPADHYVIMVNDEFRNHAKSVEEWAKCYTEWELSHHLGGQNSAAFVLSDADKRDQKGRTSSMVAVEYKDAIKTQRSNSFYAVYELTYRYFLNLWFNPGILFTRVAMYTMLGKC